MNVDQDGQGQGDTLVVVNVEGQYSIWQRQLDLPDGWSSVGVAGTKAECLDYIERTWTDMRPLSLQRAMAAGGTPSPQQAQADS